MIDKDLFQRSPCDTSCGFHNLPGCAAGKLARRDGGRCNAAVSGLKTHGAVIA
jgi:hypothetical protein